VASVVHSLAVELVAPKGTRSGSHARGRHGAMVGHIDRLILIRL